MSGGAFDYAQYRISEIYSVIEDEIYGHELEDEWEVNHYLEDRFVHELQHLLYGLKINSEMEV